MASASATMGLYLAGSIAVPQYLGFDRLDPASLATITPDNIGSKIVIFIPAFAGAAGFVLPPHLKNVLGLLKLTRRASSSSSGASSAMQAEQAGIAPSSAAASEPAASQLQASPAAAALTQPELAAAAVAPAPAAAINMEETVSMIEDMVGKKVGEVVTDVTNMKNDVASFKGDITALKENIENLTLSFESSLTDLKAFQAEMVNPLNFMRRYFETMDIKNLSDPMQPLPHMGEPAAAKAEQPAMAPAASVEGSETRRAEQQQQKLQDHNDGDNNNGNSNNNKKIDNLAARPPSTRRRQEGEEGEGDDDEGERTEKQQLAQLQLSEAELRAAFRDLLPGIAPEMQPQQQLPPAEGEPQMVVAAAGSRDGGRPREETTTAATAAASGGNGNGHAGSQMFHGSLTLGKLMSMVSILEKLLRDIGPDELEVLIEQYRQFGLKAEDEAAVYNVVSMLKDFDMSPDEVMVQLYRLGQVMGIRDAQADLEYAKLQARIKSARRMQQQQQVMAATTTAAPTPAAATASRGDHLGHAYGRREQADG